MEGTTDDTAKEEVEDKPTPEQEAPEKADAEKEADKE